MLRNRIIRAATAEPAPPAPPPVTSGLLGTSTKYLDTFPLSFAPAAAGAEVNDCVVYCAIIDDPSTLISSTSAELVQRKNNEFTGAICYTSDFWTGASPLTLGTVDFGPWPPVMSVWAAFRDYVFSTIGTVDVNGDSLTPVAGPVSVLYNNSIALAIVTAYTSGGVPVVSGGGVSWTRIADEGGLFGGGNPSIDMHIATGVPAGTLAGVAVSGASYPCNVYTIILRPF